MAATRKIDFINGAYSQMRISGLTVDPNSFDLSTGLNRLENMMSLFCSRNLCTDYNFTENPDLNDFTNVSQVFNLMIESNLALKLCPDFGKEIPMALKMLADSTLSAGSGVSALDILQPIPYPQRMPRGSGTTQKFSTWINYQRTPAPPPESCTTHDLYINDINDYEENWTAYLNGGESIASYTIVADEGLLLVSNSLVNPIVYFRVQGISQQMSGSWQQIKIIVTTSTGRKNTRFVNFKVMQPQTVGTTSP
jgi:hypothetical protein